MLTTRLIQIFKILHNDHVDKYKFITFVVDNRKGHSLKLYKSSLNFDTGKFAFPFSLHYVVLCK